MASIRHTYRCLGLIIVLCMMSCQGHRSDGMADGDEGVMGLQRIKARGKLIALTETSSTSYFIYKGRPMGFEYELLHSFANHLGVDLEIRVIENFDDIFTQLLTGEADVVAANLTITKERKKIVDFTEYHLLTRQVLVQHKPVGWEKMKQTEIDKHLIRNPLDLAGKTIEVRKSSSFYQRLLNLSDEIGGKINIVESPGELSQEELIRLVALGEIDMTVADENVALINNTYYPDIDVATPISFPQRIAWAVSKSSPMLLQELNRWLHQTKRKPAYYTLYRKYFLSPKASSERMNSEYSSLSGGKISAFDDDIRKFSQRIDWDWRLLAAQIYQESHFNPEARSWAGAYGLTQLMPGTARQMGFDTITTASQSIEAGVKLIEKLDNYWQTYVEDKDERIKFILASYNVGLGHVVDARQLAIKNHYNPNVWFGQVDKFLILKSQPKYFKDPVVKYGYCRGDEPVKYVQDILNRYEHYCNNIGQTEPEIHSHNFAQTPR